MQREDFLFDIPQSHTCAKPHTFLFSLIAQILVRSKVSVYAVTSCKGCCDEPPSLGRKNFASSCWTCRWQAPVPRWPALELVQLPRAAFPTVMTPSQSSCHSVTVQHGGKRPFLKLGKILEGQLGFRAPYGVS